MFLLCQLVIQRFLIETVLWKILSFSSSFSKITPIIIFILCDKCNIHRQTVITVWITLIYLYSDKWTTKFGSARTKNFHTHAHKHTLTQSRRTQAHRFNHVCKYLEIYMESFQLAIYHGNRVKAPWKIKSAKNELSTLEIEVAKKIH